MKILFLVFSVVALIACSSGHEVTYAEHSTGKGIQKIDDMIVELKGDYYKQCYEPLMDGLVPENTCQHELFSILERRYHRRFETKYMNLAADDAFFRAFSKRVKRLIRSDQEVREQVRNHFNSYDDLVEYYRGKYSFSLQAVAN